MNRIRYTSRISLSVLVYSYSVISRGEGEGLVLASLQYSRAIGAGKERAGLRDHKLSLNLFISPAGGEGKTRMDDTQHGTPFRRSGPGRPPSRGASYW